MDGEDVPEVEGGVGRACEGTTGSFVADFSLDEEEGGGGATTTAVEGEGEDKTGICKKMRIVLALSG